MPRSGNEPSGRLPIAGVAGIAVLILLACASWFYKHRPSKTSPSTTQASQTPTTPKLSDSYARAALLALIKIESDESVPVDRDGQEYVNRITADAIDIANANATTSEEKAITVLLLKLYSYQLQQNRYYGAIFSGRKLSDKQIKAVINAQIEISKRDGPCFEALDSALRAREAKMPTACGVF